MENHSTKQKTATIMCNRISSCNRIFFRWWNEYFCWFSIWNTTKLTWYVLVITVFKLWIVFLILGTTNCDEWFLSNPLSNSLCYFEPFYRRIRIELSPNAKIVPNVLNAKNFAGTFQNHLKFLTRSIQNWFNDLYSQEFLAINILGTKNDLIPSFTLQSPSKSMISVSIEANRLSQENARSIDNEFYTFIVTDLHFVSRVVVFCS